jgi:CRISPR-associated protein Csm3
MNPTSDSAKTLTFKGQIVVSGVLECMSGLHVGGNRAALNLAGVETPVYRDPATRMPVIPGSSLKGRLRGLLELLRGRVRFERGSVRGLDTPDAIDLLFGSASQHRRGGPTRLVVRDATPSATDGRDSTLAYWAALDTDGLGTEVKAEASLNRVTAAAQARQVERVVAGSRFNIEFVISVFDERADEEALVKDLVIALQLLEDSYLGGHGSRGYGKVRVMLRENPAFASAKDYESGRRRTTPSGELRGLGDIDADAWVASAKNAFGTGAA